MVLPNTMQGRDFGPTVLEEIRELLRAHPDWSRYRLSRELAQGWNWYSPSGQLKDMAARTLLGKLASRGWIELPAARMASPTRSGRRDPPARLDLNRVESSCSGALTLWQPLQLMEMSSSRDPGSRKRLENCLHQYHYLGYQSRVGENLQYWIESRQGTPLACVVFGAAAWHCAPRDRWIGWTPSQRAQGLSRVANNTRFLIFPWVQIPHLASHILGKVAARIATDWQRKYHHSIELLETFVDGTRFRGSCYRASNWVHVGQTQGRGRRSVLPSQF